MYILNKFLSYKKHVANCTAENDAFIINVHQI